MADLPQQVSRVVPSYRARAAAATPPEEIREANRLRNEYDAEELLDFSCRMPVRSLLVGIIDQIDL